MMKGWMSGSETDGCVIINTTRVVVKTVLLTAVDGE